MAHAGLVTELPAPTTSLAADPPTCDGGDCRGAQEALEAGLDAAVNVDVKPSTKALPRRVAPASAPALAVGVQASTEAPAAAPAAAVPDVQVTSDAPFPVSKQQASAGIVTTRHGLSGAAKHVAPPMSQCPDVSDDRMKAYDLPPLSELLPRLQGRTLAFVGDSLVRWLYVATMEGIAGPGTSTPSLAPVYCSIRTYVPCYQRA